MPSGRIYKRTHAVANNNENRDPNSIARVSELPPQVSQQLAPQVRRVLEDTQLQNQELRNRILQLEEDKVQYELDGPVRKKCRGARGQRAIASDGYEAAIAQAGRKHTVMMHALGVSPSLLQKNLDDVADLEQCTIIEEYIEVLPYEAHEDYQNPHVINLFLNNGGSLRSVLVSRLMNLCLSDVYGKEIAEAVNTEPRGTTSVLHALLGRENGSYPRVPPFILGDGEGNESSRLFRVPFLAKALRACLLGPASLKHDCASVSHAEVYAKLWQVTKVTPGAIAFVATVTRYIFSPDTEFSNIGGNSSISYRATFQGYLKLATKIQTTIAGCETYHMWNSIVFGGTDIPFEISNEVGLDQVDALENEIEAQHELEVNEALEANEDL